MVCWTIACNLLHLEVLELRVASVGPGRRQYPCLDQGHMVWSQVRLGVCEVLPPRCGPTALSCALLAHQHPCLARPIAMGIVTPESRQLLTTKAQALLCHPYLDGMS
jgi:hypothetical protein